MNSTNEERLVIGIVVVAVAAAAAAAVVRGEALVVVVGVEALAASADGQRRARRVRRVRGRGRGGCLFRPIGVERGHLALDRVEVCVLARNCATHLTTHLEAADLLQAHRLQFRFKNKQANKQIKKTNIL